jgi:hypothetical protein
MLPEVLYLILCKDVQSDLGAFHRITVVDLLTSIRSTVIPPFPVRERLFSVLLLMTGCQGSGELAVQIVQAQTGTVIFRTRRRPVRFVGDPSDVLGAQFRICNCSFPAAGLYWVEVVYQGSLLARQKLVLKV